MNTKECSLPQCGRPINLARSSHIRMRDAAGTYRYFCAHRCWQTYWDTVARREPGAAAVSAAAGLLRLRWRPAS